MIDMARSTKPLAKGNSKERVAVIRAFTDSAERIGPDAALMGIIAIFGFGALAVGADTGGVVLLALLVWCGWVVIKFANAYLTSWREQIELDKVRIERGQKILEAHPDRQRRLALPKTDGGNDD